MGKDNASVVNKQVQEGSIFDKCTKMTVTFPEPAVFDGEEVREVTLRSAIGADIEQFVGMSAGKMNTGLFALLAEVDERDVRALSGKNYLAALQAVEGLL